MDVIKTSLIIGIAVTLYYLLLQWPNQQPITQIQKEKPIEESFIVDSNDSLTNKLVPMDDPVVLTNQPALLQDKIYKVGNKDLVLDVRADTGQIIGSELTNFKRSLGGGDPLQILGGVGGNLYLVNSGFYTPDTGYLNPNFKNLIEKEGVDGSIVFVLSGVLRSQRE